MKEIFDLVFVETVGIGQNEIEIRLLADMVALVMQPLGGDEIQFMKAGIMDIPDIFIMNKCDEESLAQNSYRQLKSAISLELRENKKSIYTKLGEKHTTEPPDIFLTSNLNQKGISGLGDYFLAESKKWKKLSENSYADSQKSLAGQKEYFLKKIVHKKYGEYGWKIAQNLIKEEGISANYFEASAQLLESIENRLSLNQLNNKLNEKAQR